jgi:hypothetical protein
MGRLAEGLVAVVTVAAVGALGVVGGSSYSTEGSGADQGKFKPCPTDTTLDNTTLPNTQGLTYGYRPGGSFGTDVFSAGHGRIALRDTGSELALSKGQYSERPQRPTRTVNWGNDGFSLGYQPTANLIPSNTVVSFSQSGNTYTAEGFPVKGNSTVTKIRVSACSNRPKS